MPTVRTGEHLLLESTTKFVESVTYDVICQFYTVKGMVVESEVLKAQNCALRKLSLLMHSNDSCQIAQIEKCIQSSIQTQINNCFPYESLNHKQKQELTTSEEPNKIRGLSITLSKQRRACFLIHFRET